MPKKKSQDDSTTVAPAPTAKTQPAAQQGTEGKRNTIILYAILILVVVIVIALAYYAISSLTGGSGLNSRQALDSLSNSSLNQTQMMLLSDFQKTENLTAIYASYFSGNGTTYVNEPGNITIAINNTQTVGSYLLGSYNRSDLSNPVIYTNVKTRQVIASNTSGIEYYRTANTTITCFNQTTLSSGVTNSSIDCTNGDGGISSLEQFPFSIGNVTALAAQMLAANLTYGGTKTIIGRPCDSFVASNETTSNLLSNYSVIAVCIDRQYGIPLYLNETDIVGGIPNSTEFTITRISTNVSGSDFVIPQKYLDNLSQSII